MPVSKHRRRGKQRTRRPRPAPGASRPTIITLDDLRQEIANPARDFRGKVVLAGVWWFDGLLLMLGDLGTPTRSEQDATMSGSLLCLAMDGRRGDNDTISPLLADLLRPYCPTPSFVEAWEQANDMPPGTVVALVTDGAAEQDAAPDQGSTRNAR